MTSVPAARRALLPVATLAALFALASILLLYSSRPATADEPVLPGEAPDRDSAPASGLIWAGLGGTLTPPEPVTPAAATGPEPTTAPPAKPADGQRISTPERVVAPRKDADDVKGKAAAGVSFKSTTPESKTLSITIPRIGLENVPMPDSPSQSVLDRHGIMHLSGTGFPWQPNSNTYVAGHAQGYAVSRFQRVFRDIEDLRDGDRVVLRDANGKAYTYRVYKSFVVNPTDYWVTRPVRGKQVVTLQTCWPAPSYEQRLIVRAERVG